MDDHILLIAGPSGDDERLVAAVAARQPARVTVLIEPRDRAWDWRDRLATLLAALERATGASVVGLLGAVEPRGADFDGVVRGRPLLHVA
jgi:hypothetical protein